MGDFNDTPSDVSIHKELRAIAYPATFISPHSLYNLFSTSRLLSKPGSHKYQGEWAQLDQIIVSGTLINPGKSMHLLPESIKIFDPSFLLVPDKTHLGKRPFRTFYGYKYEGGYSDHLPILTDFSLSLAPQEY